MLWKANPLLTIKLPALALGACLLPLGITDAAAQSSTTVVSGPATKAVKAQGVKTAVVAATDRGGDQEVALRALKAAHVALARSSGYAVMPADQVALSLQKANLRWPFVPRQYPDVRKKLDKADRVMAVTVTPVEGAGQTYSATVELFDTNNGGLVGRGESSYTSTTQSEPLVTTTTLTPSLAPTNDELVLGSFEVPAGTAGPAPVLAAQPGGVAVAEDSAEIDPRFLAVDGAILRAVDQMNEPASITGIIISKPGGYTTRLSKGAVHGLRNGARIEYLARGQVIAYGTAIDVGKGDTLATVAPERTFPMLEVNGDFRTVENPPAGIAGRSRDEIDEREWRRFERDFGLAAGIAALGYLIFIR